MEKILEVKNISRSFGDNHVLDDISFDLHHEESLVVIGGSGTGKSVLIKCIMGLLYPNSGSLKMKGVEVAQLSVAKRQKILSFGMLFQGGALFDSLSVWENIAFGLMQGQHMSKEEAHQIALLKLEAVNLEKRVANLYPAELSGGMQKRVALARAIATNPEILFFDEPTTGLDPIVSGTINTLIKKSVNDLGVSAITITHDMHSLRAIATSVALLFKGRFVWKGTVAEMEKTDNPYVQQFINGNAHGPFTDVA